MQHNETVEKSQEGGSEWELSEAIKLMGEAQASGDPEQIATAMRRHAEALTNSTNTTMIPTLRNVLETVVRTEIGKLSTRIDNSDKARLARNTQFQLELNTRLDGHAHVLDEDVKRLAASVEGAATLAGKAHTLAGQAIAGVETLAGIVSDQGEEIKAIAERVGIVEATPGTYPDLLSGMQHLERMVRQNSERSDRRQMYLLIAIGSIILLFVVLVALQIASG